MFAKNRELIAYGLIVILTVLCFVVRFQNYKAHLTTHRVTVDENVYFSIAKQLQQDPTAFNARAYVRWNKNPEHLVDYMSAPLFKHPPVFFYLLAGSLRLFGDGDFAVILTSLLFGCLIIPVAFLLGRLAHGRATGLLAAALVALDPVMTICSQKVWLETTLVFFVVLSAYLYLKGFQSGRTVYFYSGGISLGLAALTKYPGILTIVPVWLFGMTDHKKAGQQRSFFMSLVIPLVMLVPWMGWNLKVYGWSFFYEAARVHGFLLKMPGQVFIPIFLAGALGVWCFLKFGKGRGQGVAVWLRKNDEVLKYLFLALLVLAVAPAIAKVARVSDMPQTTWERGGLSRNDGVLFYIRKLVEFSAFYILAYVALLTNTRPLSGCLGSIKSHAVVYLLFYSLYGNHQSRYVLMAVPFLLILGAALWLDLYQAAGRLQDQRKAWAVSALLLFFLVAAISKTMLINVSVSFPNDMCYF